VIAEHVLGFFGNVAAGNVVDVLVVAEGEMDVVESAVRFVDAVLGLVLWDIAVGAGGEEFRENNFAGVGTTYREGVADHGPLRLTIETEDFAEVVEESGEDEPAGMAVLANRFGRLQEMFDLGEIGVGVAFVHQRVEVVGHFPNAFFAASEVAVLGFFWSTKS